MVHKSQAGGGGQTWRLDVSNRWEMGVTDRYIDNQGRNFLILCKKGPHISSNLHGIKHQVYYLKSSTPALGDVFDLGFVFASLFLCHRESNQREPCWTTLFQIKAVGFTFSFLLWHDSKYTFFTPVLAGTLPHTPPKLRKGMLLGE